MTGGARFVLRMAWRESRASLGRLWMLTASVSVGVAALVAVNSFTDDLRDAVRGQARALLGADLSAGSSAPFSERAEAELARVAQGAAVARVARFQAMAFVPAGTSARLAQVTAVEGGYPFYGAIITAPAAAWERLRTERAAVVDEALLQTLAARIGDTLALGDARFTIAGTVVSAPGDVSIQSALGPRVFVPGRYLGETGLLGFGARARYVAYVRLPDDADPRRLADLHRPAFAAERVSLRTVADQGRDLDRSLGRLGRYLGLVALVALLLGGLGTASAAHVLAKRKVETAAALRCLGASGRTVLAVYALQALVLGAIGSLAGVAAGLALQRSLPLLLGDLLPVTAQGGVSWSAAATGLAVGVWTAGAFALWPLAAIRRVSPLVVLRRAAEDDARVRRDPLRLAIAGALALTVAGVAIVQTRDAASGLAFAGGIAVVLAGLWAAAAALRRGLRATAPGRASFAWRQGVANLFRPANQTTSIVLALGFGAFLLDVIVLVQHNLLRDLRSDTTADRPNLVVFDVQPDQRAEVARLLRDGGAVPRDAVPIVPMRIRSAKGQEAGLSLAVDAARPTERGQGGAWALRREYRSTYRDGLGGGETLTAGALWPPGSWRGRAPGDEPVPISVEVDLAKELKIAVGDAIVWDVQGVLVRSRVAALREVDWARMEPNFFVVFPEGTLDGAPQTFATLARAEDAAARGRLPRALAEAFPNVSALDLSEVQRAVDGVVDRVAQAVRFISLFSLATGVVVLLGALATSRYQRVREAVLLKTLGASRRQLLAIACVEYVGLGALGALAALLLATGAGWALVRFLFEARFAAPVGALAALSLGVVALTVAVGLLGSLDVFRRTPLAVLRAE
jgi:putative ABC transport system permease protein